MPSWYCPVWYSAFLFMGPVSLVLVLLRLQFGTWFVLFWALLLFLHVLFMISLEMHFCCSGSCSSITFLLMVVLVTPFNDFLLLLRFTANFAVFFIPVLFRVLFETGLKAVPIDAVGLLLVEGEGQLEVLRTRSTKAR